MTTHLVVPDTHCKPGENYERFKWLGNLATDLQPHTVVFLGDHWDMPSLCSHDAHKADFKKRSLQYDFDSGIHALSVFDKAYDVDVPFGPGPARKIILGGNHDDGRINRLLSEDERFLGIVPTLKEVIDNHVPLSWTYVPYQQSVKLDGINYSHNFPSGVMNRPIGGENPAAMLLKKLHQSCVVGHQHTLDYAERMTADGTRICGLVAGCFVDPRYKPSYAGMSQKMWRNGVAILHNVNKGQFDLQFMSIELMRKIYG